MMLSNLRKELKSLADPKQAKNLQRFFKTGKGQYGEGDIFLGIKVPVQRQVAKKYENLSLKDLQILLYSKIHEERLVALLILVSKYKNSNSMGKGDIFSFYFKHRKNINNWDLVDLSAPNIIGNYLLDHPNLRYILKKLVKSKSLWDRRIAIISTLAFIKNGKFLDDVLSISQILLKDKH
ncbi:MAG: DNA alkylation repair protein, partial [archaeon]